MPLNMLSNLSILGWFQWIEISGKKIRTKKTCRKWSNQKKMGKQNHAWKKHRLTEFVWKFKIQLGVCWHELGALVRSHSSPMKIKHLCCFSCGQITIFHTPVWGEVVWRHFDLTRWYPKKKSQEQLRGPRYKCATFSIAWTWKTITIYILGGQKKIIFFRRSHEKYYQLTFMQLFFGKFLKMTFDLHQVWRRRNWPRARFASLRQPHSRGWIEKCGPLGDIDGCHGTGTVDGRNLHRRKDL